MKIAVIGWGSLIWCPGSLLIRTRWYREGPRLPIEFARLSADGRLTLVLHPGTTAQDTYWALSQHEEISQTRENLRQREGRCRLGEIHAGALAHANEKIDWLEGGEEEEKIPDEVKTTIGAWLTANKRNGIDAAVWTGLTTNWKEKRGGATFTPDDAVTYLTQLEGKAANAKALLDRAKEYVTNTPDQIQSDVRSRMRKIGWKDNPLPDILFEAKPINQR